jgi:hypothetical protein
LSLRVIYHDKNADNWRCGQQNGLLEPKLASVELWVLMALRKVAVVLHLSSPREQDTGDLESQALRLMSTSRQPRRGLFTTETTASHQFSLNPAETMSSPQPGPPPGNASLDLEALRKQLDEDYGKAYDLMGAGTLAFSSDIERYLKTR